MTVKPRRSCSPTVSLTRSWTRRWRQCASCVGPRRSRTRPTNSPPNGGCGRSCAGAPRSRAWASSTRVPRPNRDSICGSARSRRAGRPRGTARRSSSPAQWGRSGSGRASRRRPPAGTGMDRVRGRRRRATVAHRRAGGRRPPDGPTAGDTAAAPRGGGDGACPMAPSRGMKAGPYTGGSCSNASLNLKRSTPRCSSGSATRRSRPIKRRSATCPGGTSSSRTIVTAYRRHRRRRTTSPPRRRCIRTPATRTGR